MTSSDLRERIRWYNRLAAWVYEHADWVVDLALPVWNAQAEQDLEEMAVDTEAESRREHEAYLDGCAQGYAEAEREFREPR